LFGDPLALIMASVALFGVEASLRLKLSLVLFVLTAKNSQLRAKVFQLVALRLSLFTHINTRFLPSFIKISETL